MHRLSVMHLARLVRSNVERQLCPKGRSGDSGAIAAIVGMMFAFGIVLGIGALVIDTGSLFFERRQLQNGADAAALSIAKTCALADATGTPCTASAVAPSTVVGLAGANATDQKSDVASVCGSAALSNPTTGSNLSAFPTLCPAPSNPALVECPSTSSPAKYVEVRTSTRTANGGTIMPPILAQMLYKSTYSGETVKACARVGWGPRGASGPTVPIAVSACEWFKATSGGNLLSLAPPPTSATYPQYSPFPDSLERALLINAPLLPTTDPCDVWQGHDFPGGFGWLARTPAPDCQATTDANGWVGVITGVGGGTNGGCAPIIAGYAGFLLHLPVFDCMSVNKIGPGPTPPCDNTNNGSNTNFHIQTTVAFFVTAFDIANVTASIDANHPTATAKAACKAYGTGSKCMYGWFVKDTSGGGTVGGPGTPNYGDTVIQVLG
jgi:Flp pilus assembly protein TadG